MTAIDTGLKTGARGDVGAAFLAGEGALGNMQRHVVPLGFSVELDPLREVIAEGLRRFSNGDFKGAFEFDGWLAPRVHYCLRLTKRQASAQELWLRLALLEFPDYVRARWRKSDGTLNRYRFTGEPQFLRRNALSRLWWAAENARNSSDYSPVVVALSSSGIDQYLFDLRYSHYRPAVMALLETIRTSSPALSFEQLKALSTALNVALASRCLEGMGPRWEEALDSSWLAASADASQAIQASTPELVGPTTERVDLRNWSSLKDWFVSLIEQVRAK